MESIFPHLIQPKQTRVHRWTTSRLQQLDLWYDLSRLIVLRSGHYAVDITIIHHRTGPITIKTDRHHTVDALLYATR